MDMFLNDKLQSPVYGVVINYKFAVALDIIRHAALVSAQENGEDSSGRQKLKLLSANEVANRALNIADIMVDGAVERGWIKESTVTEEERHAHAGRMRSLQYKSEFKGIEE